MNLRLQGTTYYLSSIIILSTFLLYSSCASANQEQFTIIGKKPAEDEINNVSVSGNGQYIGVATQSYAYLYNAQGELLHEPFMTLHFAWGVAPSNTGLMAVGASNNIYLVSSAGEVWHYYLRDDPAVKAELKDLQAAVRSYDIAITPDGKYIVASVTPKYNFTKYLFFFDSQSSVPLWRIPMGQKVSVQSVAISDEGNVIVAGMSDGSIHVYDKTQKFYGRYPLEPFTNEYDIKTPVDVSPSGDTIVAGNSKGTVFLFKRAGDAWNLVEVKKQTFEKQAFEQRPVSDIALCSDHVFAINDIGVVQPFSMAEFSANGPPLIPSYELPAKRGQAISVSDDCTFAVLGHGYITEFAKWTPPEITNSPAPDTKITVAVDGKRSIVKNEGTTPSHMMVFEFMSSDNNVASFECSLDNKPFSVCTSPEVFDDVSAGSHTFQVRAVGASGNVDLTPDTYDWTIPGIDIVVVLTWVGLIVAIIGTIVAVAHWRGWKFKWERRKRHDEIGE